MGPKGHPLGAPFGGAPWAGPGGQWAPFARWQAPSAPLPTVRLLFIERAMWYDFPMTTINLEKAQHDLAVLIERAVAGEEIVIVADSRKIRLAPVPALPVFDAPTARRRGYGSMEGQFKFTDAFFEPLPEDERKFWEEPNIQ